MKTANLLSSVLFLLACTIGLQAVPSLPAFAAGDNANTSQTPLIPLEVLFGDSDQTNPQLSPDGRYMAYSAPFEGVANVWIRTVGKQDDRPLTKNDGSGIWSYQWAFNSEQIIYRQDREGDDNHRLFSADVASGEVRLLTPQVAEDGHRVMARIFGGILEKPDELVIGLNLRDTAVHDAYVVNVRTGDLKLSAQGEPGITLFPGWLVDWKRNVRGYVVSAPDGSLTLKLRDGGKGPFKPVLSWNTEDSAGSRPISFTPDNRGLYMLDSSNRNTTALVEWYPGDAQRRVLIADDQYDIQFTSSNLKTHVVDMAAIARDNFEWHATDGELRNGIEAISSQLGGDYYILQRSQDDKVWLLGGVSEDYFPAFYAFSRETGQVKMLFAQSNALKGLPLVPMKPIQFNTRDGFTIHGYLSLPIGWEAPGPIVLKVHGGPWTRDYWGFDPEVQWLANRGYAVLQINFRGSAGFGKDFLNAGNREWGGKMQDDLTDAVNWAIAQGIADPKRVGIYGMSYGGYAVLCGLTFTPGLFACGVDMFGPSSLVSHLANLPPYQLNRRELWDTRVGRVPRYTEGELKGKMKPEAEWTAEEQKEVEFLRSRSPLYFVENVRAPLLVAQGANDQRVPQSESDQFVEALRARGMQVEYVVYEDEGHGFYIPENRFDFYRRAEKFLAANLGGRTEP